MTGEETNLTIGLWMSAASRIAPVAMRTSEASIGANSTISGAWVRVCVAGSWWRRRRPDGTFVIGVSAAEPGAFDARRHRGVRYRLDR